MPKKKGKKNTKTKGVNIEKRPLEYAGDMQEYAKITKSLGDRKVNLLLTDNTEILGLIPGRFRKKVWMLSGDIVIIARREFQDTKVDILHKYNNEEVRLLHKKGEIPDFFVDNQSTECDENEDWAFDDDAESINSEKKFPTDLSNDESDDDDSNIDFDKL